MPDITTALGEAYARGFLCRVLAVKQTEVDGGGVLRVDGKINRVLLSSEAVSAKGIRASG